MATAQLRKAPGPAGKLWWLLPPATALFYPQAVRALFESGKLLHRANGPADAVAWLTVIVSVELVFGMPAVGIGVAYPLGRHEETSSSELLARRIAHLAVASPAVFVLIIVAGGALRPNHPSRIIWSKRMNRHS